MKYKPFNYCAVCGRSMEDQIPYYPYGFTEVPYCEHCAKQIIRSKVQRRANARKSEADIRRRRENGEATCPVRVQREEHAENNR